MSENEYQPKPIGPIPENTVRIFARGGVVEGYEANVKFPLRVEVVDYDVCEQTGFVDNDGEDCSFSEL